MSTSRKVTIAARKQPKQDRSKQLVSDILIAASRVLAREGAHRFTSARVAEETGISVGSLYQYFPNKESILFRLQSDEWNQTGELLVAILDDRSQPPYQRLRTAVREFVRTEREEIALRTALEHAVPLYGDAPEAVSRNHAGSNAAHALIREILPHATEHERLLAREIVMTTLKAVGKKLSECNFSQEELDARSSALADMFCLYLESLRVK